MKEVGDLIAFRSKYQLGLGGYRWVQYDNQRYLVRVRKHTGYKTWRENNGLGRRRYQFYFQGRVVDPNKILPILALSDTITYGDDNTIYITKLRVP